MNIISGDLFEGFSFGNSFGNALFYSDGYLLKPIKITFPITSKIMDDLDSFREMLSLVEISIYAGNDDDHTDGIRYALEYHIDENNTEFIMVFDNIDNVFTGERLYIGYRGENMEGDTIPH